MARMAYDVVIVGAGPAGLMAAIVSAEAGCRVRICERMPEVGRKLLTTGGGRCNLTHDCSADDILSAFGRQGRMMRPAVCAYPPAEIRAWFHKAGVPTVAQPDGCVFPTSQKARDVLDALMRHATKAGVEITCRCSVKKIVARDDVVSGVDTTMGVIEAGRVIVTAGGCSYPALGSDGSGFELAAALGHAVVPPLPALVPLVTVEEWPKELAGIVLDPARVRLATQERGARKERIGPLLLTHRGLSGPPALDISGAVAAHLAEKPESCMLRVAWRADRDTAGWRTLFDSWRASHGGRALHNLLAGEMPARLAQALCRQAGVWDVAVARARRSQLDALAEWCGDAPLAIAATEGWTQAMVTRGGVAWEDVHARTLESRRASGLFFAGEILDADGPCGGYNLTWAFASGRLAGSARGAS